MNNESRRKDDHRPDRPLDWSDTETLAGQVWNAPAEPAPALEGGLTDEEIMQPWHELDGAAWDKGYDRPDPKEFARRIEALVLARLSRSSPAPVTAEPVQSIDNWPTHADLLAEDLEKIAESWSGCMYDAPGAMIDIGADLRDQFAKLKLAAPAPADRDAIRNEALKEARAAVRELQDNLETFGPYGEESARVALDGALDAIDELKFAAPVAAEAIDVLPQP